MPTTSNFGWTTPADTDLVKDGAAAIRTLGNGVDASLVDLKGGTTGQVLSKATNTDLDYTWITPNVGDITEVQAGTGISVASGTGPIPVITNTATTTIDAEGDLLVGDAADALQRLAIGSNGNVLTVDTSVDGKIKWAAPAGGGKVLQVVYGESTTETNISSTNYANTNLSATITPSSATSKVLIFIVQQARVNRDSSTTNTAGFNIVRDSTQIFETGDSTTGMGGGETGSVFFLTNGRPLHYLDSPATTSATTYKTQARVNTTANGGSVKCQYGNGKSTIILMEIGA